MSLDPNQMERLVFIKSLHETARRYSRGSQPTASFSVLSFHDAVELFLYLSAEHLDANIPQNIMEYWNEIQQQAGKQLTQKAGIDRLNQARVSLKHYGNRPTMDDVNSFRETVDDFFRENTPLVFGIDYNEILLVDLIDSESARNQIEMAEDHLNGGEFGVAIADTAIAFDTLTTEFRKRYEEEFGYGAFSVGERFGLRLPASERESVSREIYRFLRNISNTIDDFQNALQLMSLGVDYSRYVRFNLLTPRVTHLTDGSINVHPSPDKMEEEDLSRADVEFCIDFVIDSAIAIQERDIT